VTALARAAEEYLTLRASLGHDLADAHRLLPRFIAYLDAVGASTVTVADALAWVQQVDADPHSTVWPRRMSVVRGFARYMGGVDPATEIPPRDLFAARGRWRPPFIYHPGHVDALMAQARGIRTRLAGAAHETIIGLLACTGMRVGEALRLDHQDIDWAEGILLIRDSKWGKSRQIPVHYSTLTALGHYAEVRDRLCARPATSRFFLSVRGAPMSYGSVKATFRHLCDTTGVGAEAPRRPRLHDLRHTFVVNTLAEWYRAGENVDARIAGLCAYLGHRDPRSTYWYISAAPELLALAAARLEHSAGGIT
jgi:integrase/recombinase XerD